MKSLTLPKRLASFEKMAQSSLKSKVFSYLIDQKLQPTYAEYLRLNTALKTGDVTMDEVMQWVMSNPRQNRKLFETALYQGLDQLPHDVPVLTQFFHHIEQTPSWLDKSKLETAIRFTHRLGSNGTFILRDVALMSGYQYPGFNQPLIMTGALSQYAGKRLAETYKWWLDITQANSFERFNLGFTSTVYVRFVHALVRYQLSKSKDWDTSFWGVPINQYDQAMTNIAFSAVLLMGVRAIGIFPSKAESEAIMHFWKYTGWLMGIDEQWLVEKESEAWKLLKWMDYAHPKTDESSKALAKSLSKEPFERHYKYFNNFMQKKAYKKHLEITQFFIGQNKMKNLGLKPRMIAWYPFYLMAKNTLLYNSAKHSDKLSQYLQKHGRSEQEYSLALYQTWGKQLASMHQ
ncbi:hypothetical protein A7P53_08300 [Acinetobacter defluvii]|uniref:oxygenase MpaB family protein n=1 Tax=Acinetobacter defluvii TaxID=1871111 RepID=UPI00148F534F|nr:oxygenase MpaB family protein [Acinetobacter defluvii]NNP72566.1 hypothetical protein [Acinetobacter defluvii]